MKDLEQEAFIQVFKAACRKCFGSELAAPLSETESRHLSNEVLQATGLVIGAKSIKNYSLFVLNPTATKPENPSTATLDTLARYVLDAPYTDEAQRKEREAHYPWWFKYKSSQPANIAEQKKRTQRINKQQLMVLAAALLISLLIALIVVLPERIPPVFTEDFHTVEDDSLLAHGWAVKEKDDHWWDKRNALNHGLVLYTLHGDNWPDSSHTPSIKNVLVRKLPFDCFALEMHLEDFIPLRDWQQAGILLMEDTSLTSKTLRLSIAYNDFFGGFRRPGEIIIQGVASGGKDISKPEEIAHYTLFNIDSAQSTLVKDNLKRSALRIEKNDHHYRFLYSVGPIDNIAFKEAFTRDINFKPKYIGLFAIQGFVADTTHIPALIKFFSLSKTSCNK